MTDSELLENYITILVFLAAVALLLSWWWPRLSMFMFPDAIKVTYVQGLIGWYGLLNLSVSLPFLWDGDLKQGVYPLLLGLAAEMLALYLVIRDNSSRYFVFKREAHIYSDYFSLNAAHENKETGEKAEIPCEDVYGFLSDFSHRYSCLGLKFYYKEIHGRDKVNYRILGAFFAESAHDFADTLRNIDYVQDKAIDVKSTFVFFLEFLFRRDKNKRIYKEYDEAASKIMAVMQELKMTFKDLPYDLAKYLAAFENLRACEKKDKSRITLEIADSALPPDIKPLFCSYGRVYTLPSGWPRFLKAVALFIIKKLPKNEERILVTEDAVLRLDEEGHSNIGDVSSCEKLLSAVSFDQKHYVVMENENILEFLVNALAKI